MPPKTSITESTLLTLMPNNMEYISNSGKKQIPHSRNFFRVNRSLMMNWSTRLKEAMEDRGWSGRELARRSKVNYDNIAKYLQNEVDNPRGDTIDKLAKALDVDAIWLKTGVGRAKEYGVPVVGYVGAGGQISFLDDFAKGEGLDRVAPPPGAPSNAVALIVRGSSMMPVLHDGWVLTYWDRRDDPWPLTGELCVAETADGMTYVKTLRPGLRKGTFTLESYNMEPIENVELKWAAKVEAIYTSVLWL